MGSVGGKTPTELEIYLSSNLGHNKIDIIHIVHFLSWVRGPEV